MTCHLTDHNNPVPEGAKPVSEAVQTVECSGALLIVQRELLLYERLIVKHDTEATRVYRALRPRGLTVRGAFFWAASRAVFAGTPLGGQPMPKIEDDPEVGYPDALPPLEEAG